VAYNLRDDRCYTLNDATAAVLNDLRQPITFQGLLQLRRHGPDEEQQTRETMRDFLNNGLIDLVEVNHE
jgi:hypothetical protein